MNLSKVISIGDKIDILKLDDYYKETHKGVKYSSQVFELLDEEHLHIGMPIEKGRIIPLTIGAVYVFFVYTFKGLYKCNAEVVDRFKEDNQYILKVRIISNLEKYQRRRFFRLNCIIDCEYTVLEHIDLNTELLMWDNIPKDQWISGMITDISGGGLRLIAPHRYQPEQMLGCKFTVLSRGDYETLYLRGRVLTAILADNLVDKYEIRIEFEDMGKEEREIVVKYIFEEERMRIKKKKG